MSMGWALLKDPKQIKILRYAVGLTIAIALAFAIAWPLSFLLPILSAVFLALPLPKPTLSQGLRNMRDTLFAFSVGYIFTLFILPYPLIFVPLLALALFFTYYHLNRGGSFWLVLMLLVCLLLMPMLAGVDEGLAIGVAFGLVISSWLTLAMLWLSHYVVPDPPGSATLPAGPVFQPGYSAPAAELALKSTIVALPIAIVFIANNWASQILVMLFAAIFTLSPDLAKGREAGVNSIKSTLIGGVIAFFIYWLLVAVPEYHFLVLLMFCVSLGFGVAIYSAAPIAKYMPSAMVAMIILVNSSLAEGADFSEKFVLRVLLISIATIYVVMALKALDACWPRNITMSSKNID
ncbi:MAG: DUF2955 domain-containing protein [Gammaproteobacteria bacterium]|nr:DUF2955 domain-containing protein [Gammaproteobacteria bacterium]MBT8133193.1 DUF2955 domain-containing protein [Gammaproteobacteria bacterium]NNJ50681.1 DUF2955 domain-containing protein [Gammaproteobacteria bacterium]